MAGPEKGKCEVGPSPFIPYVPANEEEEIAFYKKWCDKCWRDRDGECTILPKTLCFDPSDGDLYPSEWRYEKNRPVCTAFLSLEDGEKLWQENF